MTSTLILRFRDLSCPRGETIKRHKDIIIKEGYVWWGWWNKGHEKLPADTLKELNLKMQESDRSVYLFDSAQQKFYRANILDYKSEIDGGIETPSKKHTPTYYIENTHPLWFKFNSISEIDASEVIGNKSYEPMKDLFVSESHYEIYDSKVVASPDELTEQNRTLWRVRNRQHDDKANEIRLKDMTEIQPRHFDTVYKATSKNSLLWLSDPHFTNTSFHGYALQDGNPDKATLAKTINKAYFDGKKDIASLLISGDLTWSGDSAEFDLASQFIDYIYSVNNLDKSWLAFCPGNHDLSFYDGAEDSQKANDAIIKANYDKSRSAYGDFYAKYFDIKPNQSMTSGRKLLLNDSIPVEIVLLNSVTLQQIKGSFQGHGFIGQEQLDDVAKEMGFSKGKPRNVTRICVMHHHLMPVSLTQDAYPDAKYSTVLDAERLSRWLTEYQFDFLLHGHMHQNFNCTLERSKITHKETSESNPTNKLHVLSLGSSGVCEGHTGEEKGNWACKIEFGREKIIFHYGKISPQDSTLSTSYKLEFDYNA
ncbi:metallophosphoesterase [Vibrio cholerae]|uniref:metallophosphoesterase family protein n=1 Tax=Vibrio cholerae TaxID=666 RepID=UPI0018F1054A|nr:metallophosphoesterase [Vibrio cholerae]EGR0794731.1 metallophosphoesterase [Vibrio cholerae]EGR0808405.1 metallophosphoesterase [Vibrio cholerae]EGR0812639.1 metallophosphoesterase [Vibrio cholerae]EGR0875288.1 metallophosphoesterase [Vibrio cholerae]EJE4213920.1 metallophosphoesterase [Vibrio cholerae]